MKNITAAQARKALAAVVGFVLALLAAGVLPADIAVYVQAVIAALTAAGVYAVPNAPVDEDEPSEV